MSQTLLIDCHKIVSWLEERKKLPKDWYNYVKAAEEKIKILIRDHQQYAEYPSIQQFIKHNSQNFHYGDMNHVVQEILKTKWAEDRNIVFGYADKRVKDWVSLKKFMDNKLIGIVNTGKFISQSLKFDLPSLNKNIELLDSQVSTLKRKIDFNLNTIYQQQKQSDHELIRMGLSKNQQSIAEQIPQLIAEAPNLFASTHEKIIQLDRYVKVYEQGCAQTLASNQLKTLKYVMAHGNDVGDVYEGKISANVQQIRKHKYDGFYLWKPPNEWGISIEGSTNNSIQILTIFESRNIRQKLLEELNQLLFFFKGMKYQMGLKSLGFQAEQKINLVEGEIVDGIKIIQSALEDINGQIVNRVELKNNPKSYTMLLSKFRNYEKNIEHVKSQNIHYHRQIQQMSEKRQALVIELRRLRQKVVEAKNQCEKWLTDSIRKEIRITGEVNKLQ